MVANYRRLGVRDIYRHHRHNLCGGRQATAMSLQVININVGRITREEAENIAREVRDRWRYLGDVRPNGDIKQRANLRVTVDSFGQYHFYLNHQAVKQLLLHCKDIPDPYPLPGKQATTMDCPDDVPEFLRWASPGDSTPGQVQ